jgi:hypothetical protein
MNNYDYPAGADNEFAPWNEKTKKISVTISMTISKSVNINVDTNLNLDEYELKRLVEEQVVLPTDSDSSWYIDDFTVNED